MGKKIIIPPLILTRIFSMRRQGYSYRIIAEYTKISEQIIAYRCRGARIQPNPMNIKVSRKPGKYDHLFDEPVAQGRMYKDYTKK